VKDLPGSAIESLVTLARNPYTVSVVTRLRHSPADNPRVMVGGRRMRKRDDNLWQRHKDQGASTIRTARATSHVVSSETDTPNSFDHS
jgi:hypothetical protein